MADGKAEAYAAQIPFVDTSDVLQIQNRDREGAEHVRFRADCRGLALRMLRFVLT
jgi:hypothetical protein